MDIRVIQDLLSRRGRAHFGLVAWCARGFSLDEFYQLWLAAASTAEVLVQLWVCNCVSVRVSISESISRSSTISRISIAWVLWVGVFRSSSPAVAQMTMSGTFLSNIFDDIKPLHALCCLLDQLLMRLRLMTLRPGILVNLPVWRIHPLFKISLVNIVSSLRNEFLLKSIFYHFLTLKVFVMNSFFNLGRHFWVFHHYVVVYFHSGWTGKGQAHACKDASIAAYGRLGALTLFLWLNYFGLLRETDLFALSPRLLQFFQVKARNLRSFVSTREWWLFLILILFSPLIMCLLDHFRIKRQVGLLTSRLLSFRPLLLVRWLFIRFSHILSVPEKLFLWLMDWGLFVRVLSVRSFDQYGLPSLGFPESFEVSEMDLNDTSSCVKIGHDFGVWQVCLVLMSVQPDQLVNPSYLSDRVHRSSAYRYSMVTFTWPYLHVDWGNLLRVFWLKITWLLLWDIESAHGVGLLSFLSLAKSSQDWLCASEMKRGGHVFLGRKRYAYLFGGLQAALVPLMSHIGYLVLLNRSLSWYLLGIFVWLLVLRLGPLNSLGLVERVHPCVNN